jgi:hypothetical protein
VSEAGAPEAQAEASDDHTVGEAAGTPDAGDASDGGLEAASPYACLKPVPILVADADTGFDNCNGALAVPGYYDGVRRRAAVTCPSSLPRPSGGACVLDAGALDAGSADAMPFANGYTFPTNELCHRDNDCAAMPFGHCEPWAPDGGVRATDCRCIPGCLRDSDCPTSEVCLCGDPVGKCVPADCRTGLDCGSGLDCVAAEPAGLCSPRFSCQTPTDECFPGSNSCSGGECISENGRFTCGPYNICGI